MPTAASWPTPRAGPTSTSGCSTARSTSTARASRATFQLTYYRVNDIRVKDVFDELERNSTETSGATAR